MNTEKIVVKGEEIICYSKGRGDTTLFFIHGNSMSTQLFEKQFNSALAERHHIVAVDLPGHGASADARRPDRNYSFKGLADIIAGVTEVMKLETVIYIGHSLGGHILLQEGYRLPAIAGMVVFGSTPFNLPPRFDKAFNPTPVNKCFFSGSHDDNLSSKWAELLVAPGAELPGLILRNIRDTDPQFRISIGDIINEGRLNDETLAIENLPVPLALIQGKEDQLLNREYLKNLCLKNLWRGEIQYLDGGHSIQWENPDTFNKLITEYAEDLST